STNSSGGAMAVDEPIDIEQLSISPLDEVDAREMREFLLGAQKNCWGDRDLSRDHDAYWFRQFVTAGLVARSRSMIVHCLLCVIPIVALAYILLVAARTDFPHQGIGRLLYQPFIGHARQLGVASMEAMTMTESSGAFSFHSSLGFSGEL